MPSKIKIRFLRSQGHDIGNGCYIGFSYIQAKKIIMGDNVNIGHFNIIKGLISLRLETGCRMTLGNWITGGSSGKFILGRNSSISTYHYFDASAEILIEANSIIAGRGSQFFTHGITPNDLNECKPISIGSWCYVGSAVRFVPGSGIAHHTFVGMGAVVTKKFDQDFILIGGSPAVVRKEIPKNAPFFERDFISHRHHPPYYKG